MTPEQALEHLVNAARAAALPYSMHALTDQAAAVLAASIKLLKEAQALTSAPKMEQGD